MVVNRMDEVAELYGKRLNEWFRIRGADGSEYDAVFHQHGFKVRGSGDRYGDTDAYYLVDLLTGYFEVMED